MKILNMELCTPAIVYLAISVITFLMALTKKPKVSYIIYSLIWIPLWTALLNWVCSKGYTAVSWFLVLLPIITMFLLIVMIMSTLQKH